jgi:superfamily II DNA or RNA helicase
MAFKSFRVPPKTLVITSRIPIIHQFRELFAAELGDNNNVDYLCIQSAYRYVAEYDFVIIDEVHRALSPEYRKVFQSIKATSMLCLTATIPDEEEYVEFLGIVAPVVYAKSLLDVVDKGILPKFNIYNLEVGMDKSMAGKYKAFDNVFNTSLIKLDRLRSEDPNLSSRYRNVFDLAKAEQYSDDRELKTLCKQYWGAMQLRKLVVYNNLTKISVAKAIIEKFEPNRKWLLFTKSIKFAEALRSVVGGRVYHSKMKLKSREIVLQAFKNGDFNLLIAVDALNEGVNLPDVDGAICLSGVSTKLTNTQQTGRILRFKEGKMKPIFINLYTKNSVEKNWVDAKTVGAGLKSVTK